MLFGADCQKILDDQETVANRIDMFPRTRKNGNMDARHKFCTGKGKDVLPFNSCHVETVCLLSNRKQKPDSYVKLSLNMEDYYRIKDAEKEQ